MKEAEIRPQGLFNRYLEMARKDITRFFSDKSEFLSVPCPACECPEGSEAIHKLGFVYKSCRKCGSLYMSPRPSQAMFDTYYRESEAARFWSTDFYKETEEARREKIFRVRARLVADFAERFQIPLEAGIADIGSGYGIFLEEVDRLNLFRKIVGVEPSPGLADVCRKKGYCVVEKKAEELGDTEGRVGVATSFEVLEHVFSPTDFLNGIRRFLIDDGILLFTTLTISGFDLQVLWEKSKSIYPPHHVNLLSVEGMRILAERCGYEVVELCTPGQLDVDIVRNAVAEDPSIELPRFFSYLLERRGEESHRQFQDFLQAHNLSSHVRLFLRKWGNARVAG